MYCFQNELVRLYRADVHAQDDAALIDAAERGSGDVVDLLAEKYGADVHAQDDAALRLAAQRGKASVVELLVNKYHANVHACGNEALLRAASYGHVDVVYFLAGKYTRWDVSIAESLAREYSQQHAKDVLNKYICGW